MKLRKESVAACSGHARNLEQYQELVEEVRHLHEIKQMKRSGTPDRKRKVKQESPIVAMSPKSFYNEQKQAQAPAVHYNNSFVNNHTKSSIGTVVMNAGSVVVPSPKKKMKLPPMAQRERDFDAP